MAFVLNAEQGMLQEAATRFLAERYDDQARRRYRDEDAGFSRAVWKDVAELGWLGAGFSEEAGGFGGGAVETMIVMEAAGGALMQEPLLGAMVLSGSLLESSGHNAELEALISGETIFASALDEAGRPSPLEPQTVAEQAADGFVLSGEKVLVLGGQAADRLLVTARGPGGLLILLVPSDAPGVTVAPHATLDGGKAATIRFEAVRLGQDALIASSNEAPAVLAEAIDRVIAAACADALGAARALYERTLDYLKTRVQFGRKIGEFQALQHRMADMFIALDEATSLSMMATATLSDPQGDNRARLLAAAKVGVMARCMHIAREAIQLHGGVGMTDELPVGDGYKRIKSLNLMFGDEEFHLDRLNALAA